MSEKNENFVGMIVGNQVRFAPAASCCCAPLIHHRVSRDQSERKIGSALQHTPDGNLRTLATGWLWIRWFATAAAVAVVLAVDLQQLRFEGKCKMKKDNNRTDQTCQHDTHVVANARAFCDIPFVQRQRL